MGQPAFEIFVSTFRWIGLSGFALSIFMFGDRAHADARRNQLTFLQCADSLRPDEYPYRNRNTEIEINGRPFKTVADGVNYSYFELRIDNHIYAVNHEGQQLDLGQVWSSHPWELNSRCLVLNTRLPEIIKLEFNEWRGAPFPKPYPYNPFRWRLLRKYKERMTLSTPSFRMELAKEGRDVFIHGRWEVYY